MRLNSLLLHLFNELFNVNGNYIPASNDLLETLGLQTTEEYNSVDAETLALEHASINSPTYINTVRETQIQPGNQNTFFTSVAQANTQAVDISTEHRPEVRIETMDAFFPEPSRNFDSYLQPNFLHNLPILSADHS